MSTPFAICVFYVSGISRLPVTIFILSQLTTANLLLLLLTSLHLSTSPFVDFAVAVAVAASLPVISTARRFGIAATIVAFFASFATAAAGCRWRC
jgi:hypothetical protein